MPRNIVIKGQCQSCLEVGGGFEAGPEGMLHRAGVRSDEYICM